MIDEVTFNVLHRLAARADQVMMRFKIAFHQQRGGVWTHFSQQSVFHEQPQIRCQPDRQIAPHSATGTQARRIRHRLVGGVAAHPVDEGEACQQEEDAGRRRHAAGHPGTKSEPGAALGPDHPHTFASERNLALLRGARDGHGDAEPEDGKAPTAQAQS